MNLIARLIGFLLERFPQLGPKLAAELSKRFKQTFVAGPQLAIEAGKKAASSPGAKTIVLSVLGGVFGTVAVDQAISMIEGESSVSKSEVSDLQSTLRALITTNSGDGTDTIWGEDAEDYKAHKERELMAFRIIEEASSITGGVKGLRQLYVAFHTLELEQIDSYVAHKRIFS